MGHKNFEELNEKCRQINQEHLLTFWDQLDTHEKDRLAAHIDQLEPDLIKKFQLLLKQDIEPDEQSETTLEPMPVFTLPKTNAERERFHHYRQRGEEILRQGKMAVVLVAGGQGTRLGFPHPKGMFPVGPVSNRTLFQYHTEKIRALENRHDVSIPFYIMTSPLNRNETEIFFKRNNYFGKSPDSVIFFEQGMLPAMDENGRIYLRDQDTLFMSPDGHGGLLRALSKNGLLKDMRQRSVEYMFYFQVDNPLVKICDPVYIGGHVDQDAEMSVKTIYKRSWDEKLGVPGIRNGQQVVIEYSELSEEEKKAKTEDGTFKYGQGSIAIHLFNVDFFERLSANDYLPFHVAHKKIDHITMDGKKVEPDEPNGYKFEQFIFDALPRAEEVMIMETDRNEEFSPIKNAKGEDSPATARQDLSNLFARWLEDCQVNVERNNDGNSVFRIEISPTFAMDEKELLEKLPENFVSQGDVLLE